jgi:D-glycero-D-manno-heptose 1,7-bisphosphate phosphatase
LREFVDNDGIWCQVARPPAGPRAGAVFRGRAALFLDRDGVIVEEVGYLHRPEDVRLVPGAAAAIAAANRAGAPVVAITNQSGIGRGHYGWPEFQKTQERIAAALDLEAGAALDMVLACPYHPEGAPPFRHPAHPCRKPRPGMILRAAERLGLDLSGSWIVGDRALDLEAGRAAGLAGGLHVLTGYGAHERAEAEALAGDRFRVLLAESLAAAPGLLPPFQPSQGSSDRPAAES